MLFAGKQAEPARGLLLHVGNLATVGTVLVAGALQVLAQQL